MSKCLFHAIIVSVAALSAGIASAQPLLAERKTITAAAARKLVDACMIIANRDHFAVAIAVVDPGGNLLSFQATDGATETAILTAQLKAKTAARWRRTTEDLKERVDRQINRAAEFTGDFPQTGGYPIFIAGEIVGAIGAGAGGLSGNQDEECAQNAITTVFGEAASVLRTQQQAQIILSPPRVDQPTPTPVP
jgi:glc operon protein GlcG